MGSKIKVENVDDQRKKREKVSNQNQSLYVSRRFSQIQAVRS